MELDLDELRAAYDHPADKSVIEVIDRLERAEVDVADMRAALVAIQELHEPVYECSCRSEHAPACTGCVQHSWPCPTRRLADDALGGDNND